MKRGQHRSPKNDHNKAKTDAAKLADNADIPEFFQVLRRLEDALHATQNANELQQHRIGDLQQELVGIRSEVTYLKAENDILRREIAEQDRKLHEYSFKHEKHRPHPYPTPESLIDNLNDNRDRAFTFIPDNRFFDSLLDIDGRFEKAGPPPSDEALSLPVPLLPPLGSPPRPPRLRYPPAVAWTVPIDDLRRHSTAGRTPAPSPLRTPRRRPLRPTQLRALSPSERMPLLTDEQLKLARSVAWHIRINNESDTERLTAPPPPPAPLVAASLPQRPRSRAAWKTPELVTTRRKLINPLRRLLQHERAPVDPAAAELQARINAQRAAALIRAALADDTAAAMLPTASSRAAAGAAPPHPAISAAIAIARANAALPGAPATRAASAPQLVAPTPVHAHGFVKNAAGLSAIATTLNSRRNQNANAHLRLQNGNGHIFGTSAPTIAKRPAAAPALPAANDRLAVPVAPVPSALEDDCHWIEIDDYTA